MSMILRLLTVSDATLGQLLINPDSIIAFLDDEGTDEEDTISDEGLSIDLDKAWHAIHYLLTGSVWEGTGPEAFLLVGGTTIGNVDLGCGPARGLTAVEICDVAAALDDIPSSKLATRFDPAELDAAEIYPEIWVRDGQVGLDYITHFYESLRTFVTTACRKKMGVLVFIT